MRGAFVGLINGVADLHALERVNNNKEIPLDTYKQKSTEILDHLRIIKTNDVLLSDEIKNQQL